VTRAGATLRAKRAPETQVLVGGEDSVEPEARAHVWAQAERDDRRLRKGIVRLNAGAPQIARRITVAVLLARADAAR